MSIEHVSDVEHKIGPEISVERLAPGHPDFDEALAVEFEVFNKMGYSDAQTATGHMKEYSDYDDVSILNVARVEGKIVGVLREIQPQEDPPQGSTGFKTLDDLQIYQDVIPPLINGVINQTIVEAGTAAILPEYRVHLKIAPRLYHSLFAANIGDKTHCIASIDDRVLKGYRRSRSLPFESIGPSQDYMGSPTTPVALDMRDLSGYLAAQNPDAYEMLIQGKF